MNKSLVLVLGASVALNLVLAGWLVNGPGAPPSAKPPQSASAPVVQARPSSIDPDVWPSLLTDDVSTLVNRLRAAGFPSDIVRAIVSGKIGELYMAKRRELDPDADSRPFWKNAPPDPKRQAALLQLYRDQGKAVREALGADADDPFSQGYQSRQLAGLPPGKVGAVKQLLQEYSEQRNDLFTGGVMTAVEREKMAELEKAQHAALGQILTPAELENYDLHTSSSANSLRYTLSAFNPTEAEFRALFPLQRDFDDRFGRMYEAPSPEQSRARGEAQRQLTQQFKDALGPERAADYVRATDFNYRQTSMLVSRLQLPPETANQIYEVQTDLLQRSQALRSLPADQRTQQLAALAEEAKSKISTSLGGERGYEAYKQYGGQWLQQLQVSPARDPVVPGVITRAP